MPAQYFNIPLANHAGLIELQEYLKTRLPEGTAFVDPAEFHITLVWVEDGDLSDITIPALPVFGAGSDFLNVFDVSQPSGDRWAVVADVTKVPQLVTLQAFIFYELQGRGLPVSVHSWPGLYKPHVTLAYTTMDPGYLNMPNALHFQVEAVQLTGEEFEVLQTFPLRAMGPVEVAEMTGTIRDTLVVGEFAGSYPTVPTFPDVDIAALTAGDDDPVFVTLPIGEDNVVSTNGIFYSDAFVKELEKSVFDKRPTGIQGHLKDDERASAFPIPVTYWVGTAKVGNTLWGKAYIPVGETRDMVQRRRAQKGKLATSIYGTGEPTWNQKMGALELLPEKFNLEQIDLAPPDRAGVASLARVPHITKEMTNNPPEQEQETMAEEIQQDRRIVINEMTENDIRYMTDEIKEVIMNASPQAKLITEMTEVLGVEVDEMMWTIKELVKERDKVRQQAIAGAIESAVAAAVMPNAKQITEKVKAVRGTVAELVRVRQPKTEEEVKLAVEDVVQLPHIKTMVEGMTVAEMGGNHGRSAVRVSGGGGEESFFIIPGEEDGK